MMPPAPGAIVDHDLLAPRSVKRCAIARAVKSTALPAEPGTMMRIGREGYV